MLFFVKIAHTLSIFIRIVYYIIIDLLGGIVYTFHMPITKQASKKLRHDRIRTKQNAKIRHDVDMIVKKHEKGQTRKQSLSHIKFLIKRRKRTVSTKTLQQEPNPVFQNY